MTVDFHPRAHADYLDAAKYYVEISKELARAFLEEVEQAVKRIEDFPEAWPIVDDDIRRLTLNRFPFGIYYSIEDDVALIHAVLHMKRHPDRWKRRRRTI